MARSVNKVILLGNLGKDAELNYLPSGQAVSKFTLATNRRFKDKAGEWQEQTEWHNIVLWGKMAESLTQYLTKGQKVYLEGRIQSRTWEGRDGSKHYATDIVANDVVLASGRGGEESSGQRAQASQPPPAAAPVAPSSDEGISPEITDDDIPF
jgi:single-strand DNA-binding protein